MNLEEHEGTDVSAQSLPENEEPAGGPGNYPKIGSVISIHVKSKGEVAATVTGSSLDEISIELARASSVPFRKGDRVRLKYWAEGAMAYYWDAKVLRKAKKQMKLLLGSEGVTVQRRTAYRVRARVPLTFTVIDSADSYLIGETAKCKTQNISVGGLAFETSLPMKVGDKLAVKLHFSSSRHVDAVGWILRSDQVEREGVQVHSVALAFLQCEAEDQNQLLQFLVFADRIH